MPDLLPDLHLPMFILTVCAAFLAGAVRGFAGFGSALVLAPVLALAYGPIVAVPLMSVLQLPVMYQLIRITRKETDWRRTGPMAATALVSIPLGAAVLKSLDPEMLRIGISGIVLGLAAVMAVGGLPRVARTRTRDMVAASTAGAMGGSTGIGGPPLVLYFLATGEPARQVRGDLSGYFMVTGVVGLATYFAYGLITLKILILGGVLSVPHFAGMSFGGYLFPRASEKTFRWIALSILACVGVGTLLK
ncbi:MAG: sulfite exporter TauE/SafE family protein [Thalassobaculaceae bacterium]|nr:sulfite exporter TauE/SafE family protein [Thalassobaculaceae bacterium]